MTSNTKGGDTSINIKKLAAVFDTNSIFTGSGFYLLNQDVKRLIEETAVNSKVDVTWIIPGIVVSERIFRLKERGLAHHGKLQDISALLDRDLRVSEKDIFDSIEMSVKKTLDQYGIEVRDPDWKKVDIQELVSAATNRTPPFSSGNSEKGFRDAIILETYIQILIDPDFSDYHLSMVTNDELLIEAVKLRGSALRDNQSVGSIEDIRGIIAVFDEELHLELIESLVPIATSFFFTPGDQKSILSSFEILARIHNEFPSAFTTRSPGTDIRQTNAPSVRQSRFQNKEADRYFWANQVIFPTNAYRISYTVGPISSTGGTIPSGIYIRDPSSITRSRSTGETIISSDAGSVIPNPTYVLENSGQVVFEVIWSAEYSKETGFTNPDVHDLIYRSIDWSS